MNLFNQLSFFLLLAILPAFSFAQGDTQKQESPVKLEYVVAQNAEVVGMGSFVVKNNYPERDLTDHLMAWDISYNGVKVIDGSYPLDEVKAGETKYIKLSKLMDLKLLENLGDGLVSLYAEVQLDDSPYEATPIVGESVVLAEAVMRKVGSPENYHIIKVGGAKIHRIANGNSVTLDIFNQLVAVDLGKGNMLAGPLRPVVSFASLSAKQEAQYLIDSLGPSRIEVDEDKLSGVIEYDLDTFGLLKLPFMLTENGLMLELEIQGGLVNPTALGIEVPLRSLGDSSLYLGQQIRPLEEFFGDSRLGLFGIPHDTLLLNPEAQDSFVETRSIFTERGDIHAAPFIYQLRPHEEGSINYVGISSHPMEIGSHILYLNRLIDSRFGRRKSKPVSGGKWLFAPKEDKD